MSFGLFLRFLADTLLIVFFYHHARQEEVSRWQKILSYFCFLPIILIMPKEPITGTIPRVLLRIVSYSLYLHLHHGHYWLLAFFEGAYGTLCFTVAQIFIGLPWLNSLILGTQQLSFPFNDICSAVLAFVIKAAVLLPVFLLRPLKGKVYLQPVSWLSIGLVLICETYLKYTVSDVGSSGFYDQTNTVVYSALLQLFLMAFSTIIISYMNSLQREHEAALNNIYDEERMRYLQSRLDQDSEIRKLHHDMKNHLLAIESYARKGEDSQEISSYVDDLLNDMQEYELQLNTGNPLIDSLLSQKIREAQKKKTQISIIMDLRPLSFMKDSDLVRIFGNAVDNALEAVERLPEKERTIRLYGEQAANLYILHISNPYEGEKQFVEGLPVTTKQNRLQHGIGLRNLRRSVATYNGSVHISTDQPGIFRLSIMIPLPEKHEEEH